MRCIKLLILTIFVLSCGGRRTVPQQRQMEYASLLKVTDNAVISICPYDGSQDTLRIDKPLGRIVCMSTSHVAALDEIGCDSVICGVSGAGYISSPALRERLERGEVSDVGYDQAPDYEALLALQPDVVLAYRVSAAASPVSSSKSSVSFSSPRFLRKAGLLSAVLTVLPDVFAGSCSFIAGASGELLSAEIPLFSEETTDLLFFLLISISVQTSVTNCTCSWLHLFCRQL